MKPFLRKNKVKSNDEPEIIPRAPGDLEVIGRLKSDEYWEWRTTIEEMMHAETKVEVSRLVVMAKELEVALLRRDHRETKNKAESAKLEYDKLKSKLEKRHKISLNDTVIEPTSFEIRLIDKDKKNNKVNE